MTPTNKIRIVRAHAKRMFLRMTPTNPRKSFWGDAVDTLDACMEDERVRLVVEEEIARAEAGHLAFGVGNGEDFANNQSGAVAFAVPAGELGDGTILAQLMAFLEWLLSDKVLTQLLTFIVMLISIFLSFNPQQEV